MPTLTIITPTYNAEKYIERCIKSVQEQSFVDYEHLIIDGNSSDNTVHLIKEQAELYPNIRWVSEKDKGIFDAMNKGVKMAKGEWIYFLGSDDYFTDNLVLERVFAKILKNDRFDVVYGNIWSELYQRIYDGAFDIEKILTRNICHQAIFYKKEVFDKNGYYNLDYKLHSDYAFNLKCFLTGNTSFNFIPVNIAFFSSGGASTLIDERFTGDYPALTSEFVLQSKFSFFKKIVHLSKVFRKIFIRKYSASIIFNHVICLDRFFFVRLAALIFLPFELVLNKMKPKQQEDFNV